MSKEEYENKTGHRHERYGDIAELHKVVFGAALRHADGIAADRGNIKVSMQPLDNVVIDTDTQSNRAERVDIHLNCKILPQVSDEQQHDKRKHKNPLIPAEGARDEVIYMRIYERTNR